MIVLPCNAFSENTVVLHDGSGGAIVCDPGMSTPQEWDLFERELAGKGWVPRAVLLTHAHMGHYTGLMHLGREALGAEGVRVGAMPRMAEFLATNGPWSQLVELGNIDVFPLQDERAVSVLHDEVTVTPLRVPHRDEFSETVGYRIAGPKRIALFIPDIDKWSTWDHSLTQELASVDFAFVDATFYNAAEVNHRDMSEIPHPFVVETMALLDDLPESERNKVHFIHMNHTNPIHRLDSDEHAKVKALGWSVGAQGMTFTL